MSMTDKEIKEFMAILKKQGREVRKSKAAARKLLKSLGLLTKSGKPKKFRQLSYVSPKT